MSFLNTRKCYNPPIETLSSDEGALGDCGPACFSKPLQCWIPGQKSP